ncbi:MAG: Ig domain-containing protein [Colwellia sp.]
MIKKNLRFFATIVSIAMSQYCLADSGETTITTNIVEINEYTSANGFKHPGIRFTKESLENMRSQVKVGQEPWASYYEGMRRSSWASLDYNPKNHNGEGLPWHDVIDNNGKVASFIEDAQAALMHSVQYVVTGDERYRAKAMYILGVYSHMNPDTVESFPDVYIKMGQPIYHMTAAAEILRATSHEGMDVALEWTEENTSNYVNNFLEPQAEAYIRKNHYFMNQFSYSLIGNVASAIFADNTDAYAEAVEWATVNATADNQGWNGSIKKQFRLMTKNDETGEDIATPYVQLVEMGRDQPHGIGNVDSLFIISQIIGSQDTKVDPETGTISTESNAIDPVHFNDDAIRKGFIEFIKYNIGYDIEWTPVSSSILVDGTVDSIYRRVNAQQRGRLTGNVYSALYYFYTYMAEGYDLTEGDNKFIKQIYDLNQQADWQSVKNGGYWGPKEHVYDSEFWMHLPANAKDTTIAPRGEPLEILDDIPSYGSSEYGEIELKNVLLEGNGSDMVEDDIGFFSIEVDTATPANFTIWRESFPNRALGLRIRSNAATKLEFSRGQNLAATSSLHIPNTNNEWRYVVFDPSRQEMGWSGDLAFFRLHSEGSSAVVDFDHIYRADSIEPPVFDLLSTQVVSYEGGSFSRDFSISGGESDVSYTLEGNVPDGVTINPSTGAFSYSASVGDAGEYVFYVIAQDDTYMNSMTVTVTVAETSTDAVSLISEHLNPDISYISVTRNPFVTAQTTAQAAVSDNLSAEQIDTALTDFLATSEALIVLTPVISEDVASDELSHLAQAPRMDYPNMVASTNTWLGALVDGDPSSFNSRWGDPSVTLDFGEGFRILPSAMHIVVRQGFPDRLGGAHLEGSVDGENWTVLTENAEHGEAMQRLEVFDEYKDSAFRYLRAFTVDCGCPVFDIGDLYLFGERKELNSNLATAPLRWFVGETLEIPVDLTVPYGVSVDFSADLPEGATFDAVTGVITWTPTAEQLGSSNLIVTADYGFTQVIVNMPVIVSEHVNAAVTELLATLGELDGYTSHSVSSFR